LHLLLSRLTHSLVRDLARGNDGLVRGNDGVFQSIYFSAELPIRWFVTLMAWVLPFTA
jgi:hypothetical protein